MNQVFYAAEYYRFNPRKGYSGRWLITHHEPNRAQRRKMAKAGGK